MPRSLRNTRTVVRSFRLNRVTPGERFRNDTRPRAPVISVSSTRKTLLRPNVICHTASPRLIQSEPREAGQRCAKWIRKPALRSNTTTD